MSKVKLAESLITRSASSLLRNKSYIGGQWVASANKQVYTVYNPANGEAVAEVADMAEEDVAQVVDSAHQSFHQWRKLSYKNRSGIVSRWGELLLKNRDDLAAIVTTEQGKPLMDAKGEVTLAATYIQWFAEEAKRIHGDVLPNHADDHRLLVLKQPVGVAALITPWNFPVNMIARKAGAALAAGCTAIIKPSEYTPLSALALADLAEEAGFPPGVFNVITFGERSTPHNVKLLLDNPLVRKLSFTGSTAIGKLLMEQCARTCKRVSMELGGNASFIVFESADIDAAVKGCIDSKFRNTGQTCVCANRIFVHDSVHDEFCAKLAAAMRTTLKVGPGFEEGVTQGPLITEKAIAKVERHVADAVSRGATVVTGGTKHPLGGQFFEPTLLTGATVDMAFASEETFGPVAPVFRFKNEDEVVDIANNTKVGLAGYFYSRDICQIWRVAEALEVGMVGVNSGLLTTEFAPFGGVKESGLGREGSRYALEEFLNKKYVCMGGIN
ncbi:uncharacterized protein TRIADDRAFT_63836 [Trichoplax adhaerens]|uniref:Succinate-semialdehyde dehydrogenase n=1 Tax=Trichoplax adhaerens TaxID=10228 RepID=B3RUT6_TRIAD|nr:hypothetical protein TRIADDRAFT_63836 [Trichoplax adhaerens]EDV25880.1 hypothetical protein TRIADDRAFT_63836 [Trichoplax adhaerens]|eukprot:XP_002111913.1 hypothetical protein TRIADDRAFT_63836 [Trichoplax adhaerens]